MMIVSGWMSFGFELAGGVRTNVGEYSMSVGAPCLRAVAPGSNSSTDGMVSPTSQAMEWPTQLLAQHLKVYTARWSPGSTTTPSILVRQRKSAPTKRHG
jgi:hypothetical protein